MDLFEKSDLQLPWCLRVVATLRIANFIAAGITSIDALAASANCNSAALGSVMEYLVNKGIFEKPSDGTFLLNDAAEGLLESAVLLGLDLNGIGGRMTGAWSTLPSYVRTGAPAYDEAFGLPFWQDLDAHPDIAESFDALIGPGGHGDFNGEFELSGGWDRVQTVVDVGGGTGAMLAAILCLRPHLRGILVELPRTVERAQQTFQAAGVASRVTSVGQSFFEALPPGADLYLLRGVLNNWGDAEAETLLRRCAEAAKPDGRVVVLKGVLPDGVRAGLSVSHIMAGGKERSVAEFKALASNAGLEVVAAAKQPSGYFVVECRTAR